MKVPSFLLMFGAMLGLAQATPIEIQVSGIVGRGRVGTDPYTATDIAGAPYTVRVFADTGLVDSDARSGYGQFRPVSTRVDVAGFGTFSVDSPDGLIQMPTMLWVPWAMGIDGAIALFTPVGTISAPDRVDGFAPCSIVDPSSYVSFSWQNLVPGGEYYMPRPEFKGLWFECYASPTNPITVQAVANLPDTTPTLPLSAFALAVLLAAARVVARQNLGEMAPKA